MQNSKSEILLPNIVPNEKNATTNYKQGSREAVIQVQHTRYKYFGRCNSYLKDRLHTIVKNDTTTNLEFFNQTCKLSL